MAIEVKLPEIGDGVKSVDVLDILVQVGDTVSANQGIVEIETDKATAEIPAPQAGKVIAIHVAKGQTIPIGGVLISLEAASASAGPSPSPSAKPAPASTPASTPPAPTPTPAKPIAPSTPSAATSPPISSMPLASAEKTARASVAPAVEHSSGSAASGANPVSAIPASASPGIIPAGPAVRRFAREVGIDLSSVPGSGSGGRIVREDVLAAVRNASQGLGVPGGSPLADQQGASPVASKGNASTAPTAVADAEAARDAWGPVQIQKMTKIRKTIANKMHESWSSVPRVTNFDDADVTELERMRLGSKEDYAKSGIKLTSMPFVIKAVALALKANPQVNASVDMVHEQIIYKNYVHIGIAVYTDRGLVVPSLRNADQLSIPAIARALQEMAESARTGSFTIDDLRGSTFSISNLGAIGGTYSTPIINTPEVAILLIGRSRKLPVVVQDEMAIRLMMPLSLSYDHRLVDGGAAARFLNDVIGFLSTPSRLFIAP